ncbi:PAAR domain-containing protein [Dyadobacter sandarakinus]|uniref:PAAR domain-containing protein n=1 Tax=Dyadobacter sandarakinus TaxID=2747268 RepID=A0ABX7I3I3_9BACT|nr:PAAR domain-containing protein [Dyadobacter sandarakinus]QRR00609.1 PAAR domain-containing protein [Dyadobacter sandarakinus]
MQAARMNDAHQCPAPLESGTGTHVGGIIQVAAPKTVFINGLMAATATDICVCPGSPNSIAKGSASVFFNGKPAARKGDPTVHGGKVAGGSSNVSIGS